MRKLHRILKCKKGMVGLEAAIVLIAFVIIAAAFAFMVINQGLFATERGKTTIQEGIKQASTPLSLDGTILVRTDSTGTRVNVIIIPLRAFGVKYVAIWRNQTVVTLKVGSKAWANIYYGILYQGSYNSTSQSYVATSTTYDPTGKAFDDFVGFQQATNGVYVNQTYSNAVQGQENATLNTAAVLAISNSNGDESLDSFEKGYLVITLSPSDAAHVRDSVTVEIRLEKTAPLSIEFNIPESMPQDTYMPISG